MLLGVKEDTSQISHIPTSNPSVIEIKSFNASLLKPTEEDVQNPTEEKENRPAKTGSLCLFLRKVKFITTFFTPIFFYTI